MADCSVNGFSVISIHTPAQGVTIGSAAAESIEAISIHTPAQGVTDMDDDELAAYQAISIHTPAQGVTR